MIAIEILYTVYYVLTLICVMVSVAFLTLLERKVLSYIQIRKGPNKVSIIGLLQPFSDVIKLFFKEQTWPLKSNYLMYYASPVFMLFIALAFWLLAPYYTGFYEFEFGLLFFLCCVGLGVYPLMISGWASNSKYALLGSLRAVAQTISYEVSLALIIMSVVVITGEYNFLDMITFQNYYPLALFMLSLALIWMVSSLAEMNRTPFDFAEGESELVSGFNVEFSGGGFALIFLAEYSMIIFMSLAMILIFFGSDLFIYTYFKMGVVIFIVLWARGTLPRYRYDKLMNLAWKSILPFSLNCLFFYTGMKIMLTL